MEKKSIAIITARGGSKRIPKKNIRDFNGMPIIAYSIKAALDSNVFDEVMVSTDSKEIADIAIAYGAKVPFFRSEATSGDTATTSDVLKEVIATYKQNGQEFEYMACIYPTAPFVTAKKLKDAYSLLKEHKASQTMTVVKYSTPPQRALSINNDNCLKYEHEEYRNTRSQDLKPLYYDAGQFYMYNIAKFIEENGQIQNGIMPIIVSELEVQDIDNEEDWKMAEIKYNNMKKRIVGVVIGASSESIEPIKKAQQQGIYVIVLDGNENAAGLKIADESIIVDVSDKEAVYNVLKKYDIDMIIPVPIGNIISTVGFINEKLDLNGIKYEQASISADKYLFHKKLNENGLRNIKSYLVNEESKVSELRIPYPAILKPRFGSGSRDVFFINSDVDLNASIEKIKNLKEDFVLEECVDGTEYGLDAAVVDGKLQIVLLRKKIITPAPIRQAISYLTVNNVGLEERLYDRIYDKISKVVKLLEYDDCLLNADLIINENDVFLIEIAPRPSGHNISNILVPLATGVDMTKEYIKYISNKEYNFDVTNIETVQMRFFDFNDVIIKKVPTKEELSKILGEDLISYNCNIKEQEYMEKVINGHSIMPRGYFIIKGTCENDLIEKSKLVLEQFESVTLKRS